MPMHFPVEDITHYPKTTQAENIEAAGTEYNRVMRQGAVVPPTSSDSPVPKGCTLETAIEYFKSHAVGEYETLYNQTAHWLEEYHAVSRAAVQKAVEPLTVDLSEVEGGSDE